MTQKLFYQIFINICHLSMISSQHDIILLQGNHEWEHVSHFGFFSEVTSWFIRDTKCFHWEVSDIWQKRGFAVLEALNIGNLPSPFVSGSFCFELTDEVVWAVQLYRHGISSVGVWLGAFCSFKVIICNASFVAVTMFLKQVFCLHVWVLECILILKTWQE